MKIVQYNSVKNSTTIKFKMEPQTTVKIVRTTEKSFIR